MKFINDLYVGLGFSYKIEVSTRPENYIGQLENWDRAEAILKSVVGKITGKDPVINEGDGAFYGPKIDISMCDSLGRWNQCGTVQLDFNLPERFGLTFLDVDQTAQQPIMIHRAVLGSMERFMSIVLEHTQGNLPFWMSPRQIMILPIKSDHHEWANEVARNLSAYEVEVNCSNDDLRQKIKEAEIMKYNYILVIGDKEVSARTVAVRSREEGDKKSKIVPMTLSEFMALLL